MSDSSLKSLDIVSSQGNYSVEIASLNGSGFASGSIGIIDDCSEVMNFVNTSSFSHLIPLRADENIKNMETCIELLGLLAAKGVQRDSAIYAIGGGIVQDISTMISSLYMRGLEWNYVPTTLVSMLDSCVGGKSSINLGKHKNIIGNFYPPKKILIDIGFIETLNSIEISAGISEGLKITYAKSPEVFQRFSDSVEAWRATNSCQELESAISTSLQAKKWFIETDEYDKKERKLLNFGHSFGHALESASGFAVPHGIGVLYGMKAAILESRHSEPCKKLIKSIDNELSISGFLKNRVRVSKSQFVSALSRDKKNSSDTQVLILPDESGRLEIIKRPLTEKNLESCWISIIEALEESELSYEIL